MVGLIIKSIGPIEQFPEIRTVFQEAAKRDPRIILIDRSLERAEMLSLIYACDCYVSLHRSEGFGAGMAEAMRFGKPVIGTNFSGNTEFLTKDSGFPVPYKLRPVEPHEYNWSTNQTWAEPDIDAAAGFMRLVVEQPELGKQRALIGQAFVRGKYGLEAVGQAITGRIADIRTELKSHP
jgi:glycosyltransferase involved in cell wall biosynthesis